MFFYLVDIDVKEMIFVLIYPKYANVVCSIQTEHQDVLMIW